MTVSGLVLNFVRRPEAMLREMARVTKRGGIVAAYVWDYGAGMQMMRYFWDVAKDVSPEAAGFDEGHTLPLHQPASLQELFERMALQTVTPRTHNVAYIQHHVA